MDEFLPHMHSQNKDLQIAGPPLSTSTTQFSSPSSPPFQLPGDWVSELRPRSDGRFDKYYYEPGTGKQFRSLSSIQKYLSGDIDGLTKRLKHHGRENMAIVPCILNRNPSFGLPDGWVVEEKPRYNAHIIDRYYYEPGTGKKFRSLSSVQKYLSDDIDSQNKDLQIVSQIPSNSTSHFSPPSSQPFQLPSDWVAELRPRSDGRFNKYYYEPGTGKQFRSLSSIQKYLSGDIDGLTKRLKHHGRENYYYEPGTGKKFRSLSSIEKYLSDDIDSVPKSLKPCDTKNMAIAPSIFKRNPSFRLPKGWVVKKKPRMRNHEHIVDRTYIEPGTGKRFRSLLSVERHIAEEKARTMASATSPHQLYLTNVAEASNPGYHTPQSGKTEASVLELGRPPASIKWVLSPVGSIWKPFMNDSPVPDSLKLKWSQASAHILSCRH